MLFKRSTRSYKKLDTFVYFNSSNSYCYCNSKSRCVGYVLILAKSCIGIISSIRDSL